jgi:ABC-type proline/glycine betaine transport system ATPase subunit
MDKGWQLVLDCLNCKTPTLGKPTLIRFINRLIKKELDQGLIDRTVETAKQKVGLAHLNSKRL